MIILLGLMCLGVLSLVVHTPSKIDTMSEKDYLEYFKTQIMGMEKSK